MCLTQHKESSKTSQSILRSTDCPLPPEELCAVTWTGLRCQQMSLILIIGAMLLLPRAPLRPVHPEDRTEHAQEQGQLQKDQEQEVDAAQQGPVGDKVTINCLPRMQRRCPLLHLSLTQVCVHLLFSGTRTRQPCLIDQGDGEPK